MDGDPEVGATLLWRRCKDLVRRWLHRRAGHAVFLHHGSGRRPRPRFRGWT